MSIVQLILRFLTMGGIYVPKGGGDWDYISRDRIISQGYEKNVPVVKTPLPELFDFERHVDNAIAIRDTRLEQEPLFSTLEIEIPTEKPVIVAFMGDTHVGGTHNAYEMIRNHTTLVADHPLAYAFLMGDLRDGFFFNPAQDEQMLSFEQQEDFIRAMLQRMGPSALAFLKGQHDTWQNKTGTDIYHTLAREMQRPVTTGPTIVKFRVGEVDYDLVLSHNFPGHSQYNNAHGPMRESRFGIQNADLYCQGDTHRKGVHQQANKDIEGGKLQTFMTTGPYKYSDHYARKKGYSPQDAMELGATWAKFDPFEKRITPFWTAAEAVDSVARYLE